MRIPSYLTMIVLAVLGGLEVPGWGQEKRPLVTASLVPIGTNSDAYWVGDGPGMRAIALDPGAAPPSTLCIAGKEGLRTIPAILNRPSVALPVTGGVLRVFANQDGTAEEEPPLFGNFKIPTTPGHYDVFLNRSPTKKGWEEPEHLVLPAARSSFPSSSYRIINLCSEPVKVKLGADTIDLAPRRTRVVPCPVATLGKLQSVQAVHVHEGKLQYIMRTGIRLISGQRVNLIIYPGRDPAKPCQATWYYQSDPLQESDRSATDRP